MKKSEAIFGLVRIPLDAVAALAALALSYYLRQANIDLVPSVQLLESATTLPPFPAYLETFVLPSILAFILFCAALGLYALQTTRSAWTETGQILLASGLWLIGIMAWYFLVQKQLFYSRVLLLHSTFFLALFVTFGRAIITLIQRRMLRSGIGVRYVVSIGRQKLPPEAKDTLARDMRYAYLGHVSDLQAVIRMAQKHDLDLVLQTDPNPESEETLQLIDYCRAHHVGYAFLPPVLADVPHLLIVDRLGLTPVIRFSPTPLDGWGRIFKRLFDIVASVIGIAILLPLMLIIALFILIDDGYPIFYISKRVGEGGRRRISILKFRSMVRDADRLKQQLMEKNHRKDGPLFKMKDDPRVTRVGKVLRRWSIDEWPQIFNVLLGQVSLVGPRPHLPDEVKLYSDYQRRVFAVKPGVTGLAQISGRSDLQFGEEVALDLKYIEEWKLQTDVWVLWRTFVVVAGRKGAD